jgi:exodeoxyribonuclease VIII
MTTIEQTAGLWPCTTEQYHAENERVGHSMLEVFRRNPAEYYGRFIARTIPAPEPSLQMKLGTLLHLLVLEPARFDRTMIQLPATHSSGKPWNWKSSTHRDERDSLYFAAHDEGKQIIETEELAMITAMADSISRHDEASRLLASAERRESAIIWEQCGVPCKALRDLSRSTFRADLKTCRDASPAGFARAAASLGYARQAAYYDTGSRAIGEPAAPFYFIAVENEPPHSVAVYELDDDAMALGIVQNSNDLTQLAKCAERDDWRPDWGFGVIPLSLPRWAQYEDETRGIE